MIEVVVVTLIMSLNIFVSAVSFPLTFPLKLYSHCIGREIRVNGIFFFFLILKQTNNFRSWIGSSILSIFFLLKEFQRWKKTYRVSREASFHNLRNWEIKKIRAFNNVMQLNRCLTPDSYSSIIFINFYHNWNILSFFFPSEFIDISLHFFLFLRPPPTCMKELPGICIVIHSLKCNLYGT